MHPSECYRLLGLPRNANFDDIKMAYRRSARKYHPDVNQGDPAAAEKFRLVQEAYQILKDVEAGILPISAPVAAKAPPKPAKNPAVSKNVKQVKIKVEVKADTPPPDPELKLKLDMIRKVQDLLRQRKYLVAVPIVEGMRARFPLAPEVVHWQAVVYQRQGCDLLMAGRLREAEIYLNKALKTDPNNRELCFEVKRDLERLQRQS